MTDDLKVFRELILWLWHSHQRPWDNDNKSVKIIVERSQAQANSFSGDRELEVYLPSEEEVSASFPTNRFFYLSPVTHKRVMVPRIHLKCDFGRNIPEIRCRLELFLLDEKLELQSLGYRFESPEGKNDHGAGLHHYYHIQMIQPPTQPLSISWLPEVQPAFPTNADDPVKLMLGMLISLYGLGYLETISREADVWNLKKYIDGFTCIRFDQFQWYRIVEIGEKHSESYNIKSDLQEFEDYIRRKYAGCKIRGITNTKYSSYKKSQQKQYPII